MAYSSSNALFLLETSYSCSASAHPSAASGDRRIWSLAGRCSRKSSMAGCLLVSPVSKIVTRSCHDIEKLFNPLCTEMMVYLKAFLFLLF